VTLEWKKCIACQTITWGEDQSKRFAEVFQASADAGYGGYFRGGGNSEQRGVRSAIARRYEKDKLTWQLRFV